MMRRRAGFAAAVAVAMLPAGAGMSAAAEPQPPEFHAPPSTKDLGGTGYAPPGGAWGPVSQSTDFIFGAEGTTVSYSYTSQSDASPINATGKHYANQYGQDPGPAQWSAFGAGTTGQSGPMPWGNSAAYPEMRFRSINVVGAMVNWSAGAGCC